MTTTLTLAQPTHPYLSRRDIERLTNWKWIYSLESAGFTTEQARRLLFLRWRFPDGHASEWPEVAR